MLQFDREKIGPVAGGLTWLWNRVSVACNLAAGSYLFCRREAWVDSGGFDETVYAGEEVFFSRRLKRWARDRGMKFKVLTGAPAITSARKLDWYGQWQILFRVLLMARPGALKNRERCDLWYRRPKSAGGKAGQGP